MATLRLLSVAAASLLLTSSLLTAQTILTRRVVSGGGGTSRSSGHVLQGTISQTAAARLSRASGDRHDVGFWYSPLRADVTTRVDLPETSAEPGTHLTIPLRLTIDQSNIDFLPRGFRARIRYNHTLLHPTGSTPACSYDGNDCVIEVTGTAEAEGDIAALGFVAALGDSERTTLQLEEFVWEKRGEEKIATVKTDGLFELLGICREGGEIRLVHSGLFASRIAAWPNPARERTTLEFVAAESGPVAFRLLDPLGREVAVLATIDAEARHMYRIDLDLGILSSGSYTVVCTGMTRRISLPLMIAQ